MANPCLQPKNSDFRGYPYLATTTYWRTTASNPCTVDVSTLEEIELIYNDSDKKYYYASTGGLASGSFFDNEKGSGVYMVINAGVVEASAGSSNNRSCMRGPVYRNDISEYESAFDTSGNYIFICYSILNIVVRYPLTGGGSNPQGTIVAGGMGANDLGHMTSTENTFLNNPNLIKCNHSNSTFAVYSSGVVKSVKIFNYSGALIRSLYDTTDPGSMFRYQTPTSSEIAKYPINPNGLLGKLTYKHYGTTEANTTRSVNELWTAVSIDYFLGSSASDSYVVLLGIWNKNDGVNNYEIWSFCAVPSPLPSGTARVNLEFTSYGHSFNNRDIISSFCRVNTSGSVHKLLMMHPLGGPDPIRGYRQTHLEMTYTTTSGLPGFTSKTVTDLGSFPYGIGSKTIEGHVACDIRVSTEGNVLCGVMVHGKSKWDTIYEAIRSWVSVAATGGLLGYLAYLGRDWIPALGDYLFNIGDVEVTWGGIIVGLAIAVVMAVVRWATHETGLVVAVQMKFVYLSGTSYSRDRGAFNTNIGDLNSVFLIISDDVNNIVQIIGTNNQSANQNAMYHLYLVETKNPVPLVGMKTIPILKKINSYRDLGSTSTFVFS